MNIVKALKCLERIRHNTRCIQSESLGLKIIIKDNEIYTMVNYSIGCGLTMRYRHLMASDWKISKLDKKEINYLDEYIPQIRDADRRRQHHRLFNE